jgi:hypothetical protein
VEHKKLVDRLVQDSKYKDLERLRKEISHNLYVIEEHIESLKIEQFEEHKQAQEVKKTLTKKLLAVE